MKIEVCCHRESVKRSIWMDQCLILCLGRLAARHYHPLRQGNPLLNPALYLDNTPSVIIVYVGKFGSSNAPFKCDITHARAAADAIKISGQDTVGTVMGVGFFDFLHGQDGVAPNGIELHPVPAICFGQNCDPLQGY